DYTQGFKGGGEEERGKPDPERRGGKGPKGFVPPMGGMYAPPGGGNGPGKGFPQMGGMFNPGGFNPGGWAPGGTGDDDALGEEQGRMIEMVIYGFATLYERFPAKPAVAAEASSQDKN